MKGYSRQKLPTPPASSPRSPLSPVSSTALNVSPPPRKRAADKPILLGSPPAKKQKKQLQQTRLSFGQSSSATCAKCGMSYLTVDPHEVAQHKKFHTRAFEGREWPKAVQSNNKIVRIDASSSLAERRAAEDLLCLVNTELNAPPANEAWKNPSNQGAMFVYIEKKRAVGMILVERASKGRPMNIDNAELTESEALPIIMGISRIYTSHKYRRQGIATKLLNECLSRFVYGLKVEKEKVAWSQPSAAGSKLAASWGLRPDGTVLVYLEDDP
uniref:N-acetyltransferase ECO1 n=1 Tax=Blastobotrys adeninivorans TaxID=409370 RepID=A0A060T7B9_BLAAD